MKDTYHYCFTSMVVAIFDCRLIRIKCQRSNVCTRITCKNMKHTFLCSWSFRAPCSTISVNLECGLICMKPIKSFSKHMKRFTKPIK